MELSATAAYACYFAVVFQTGETTFISGIVYTYQFQ